MNILRTLATRLKTISRRAWLLSLGVVVILFLTLAGILYAWDYTNSPPFCGTTCHTMPPEYAAYQVSPHARVSCVECHIGRTFVGNQFTRKAGDLMHVVRYASNQYAFPLYAAGMLPARESCEKCHWPEKFSNDRVVTVKHYADDADNSLSATYLILKTGGGTQREGRGLGIHWHVENEVDFIALDPLSQTIPWIQVKDAQGNLTVYADVEKPLTADEIARADKRRMDCIDCHNRISHTFKSPAQALDEALSLNRIDLTIPLIHKKGVEVLTPAYKTTEEANQAIDALEGFYQKEYAAYYEKNSTLVRAGLNVLKRIYRDLVYPTQDLSWTTHPDNIGHKDWSGCFRCHDGKHFTPDNQSAIRLECNVCHTLPEVSKANGPAPVISVARADEPESHRTTLWLAQHRTVFNATCQECHDTRNAGGKDNSSFCSNSACHGTKWTFAGLDAPGLAKIFPPPVPPRAAGNPAKKIPHPIGGNPDCQICHGASTIVRPYPTDHAGRANETCTACHAPSIPANVEQAAKVPPPPMKHELAGRTQCLGCHASGSASIPQVPQFHKDYEFPNSGCLNCHKSGLTVTVSGAIATPTRSATSATPATLQSPATATKVPKPALAQPVNVTHTGQTKCRLCHATGVATAPKSPPDHADFTDAMCVTCHK
ncbi:MAG: NapC/NirT family cytochrome c [Chloroflexi bacterium]|nr:NapC/NirT family cytochrome c [Chloroflexota bacterium]